MGRHGNHPARRGSYKCGGSLRRSSSTRSQSLSGLRTPFFASSMILLATASWATSGRLVYLRAAHVISNATLMTRLASGSNLEPSKNLVMVMIRSLITYASRGSVVDLLRSLRQRRLSWGDTDD